MPVNRLCNENDNMPKCEFHQSRFPMMQCGNVGDTLPWWHGDAFPHYTGMYLARVIHPTVLPVTLKVIFHVSPTCSPCHPAPKAINIYR